MLYARWIRKAVTAAALAVGLAALAPLALAADHQLRVRIDEPLRVNGQLHDPGMLTLRQLGDYNPTSTLNEIWIGNRCLGMLLARDMPGEPSTGPDSLLFTRDADGVLTLVGVSFRGEPVRELFGYVETADAGQWVAPPVRRHAVRDAGDFVATR